MKGNRSMRKTFCVAVIFVLSMSGSPLAQAGDPSQPTLSAAEQAVISRQIGTLKSPVDRQVAHEWSSAKKVAELICRPAALPVLKKRTKGIDKVFLGTDAPDSLKLESNQRLTGTGQYRTPQGWQDIRFTCDIDPDTGRVMSFTSTPVAAQP